MPEDFLIWRRMAILANLAESLSQQCLADHPQEKDDAADWPRFRWHQLASHVYLSTELEIQNFGSLIFVLHLLNVSNAKEYHCICSSNDRYCHRPFIMFIWKCCCCCCWAPRICATCKREMKS